MEILELRHFLKEYSGLGGMEGYRQLPPVLREWLFQMDLTEGAIHQAKDKERQALLESERARMSSRY
jgi:hypothetical protein